PREAVDLLLTTATDLGEPGVDAIYGRGLVNLERAFQPAGAASVTFGDAEAGLGPAGGAVPLEVALAPASGAFGDWATASGARDGLMFRDSYDRAFIAGAAPLRPASAALDRFESLAGAGRRRGGWTQTGMGEAFLRWDDAPV